MQICLASMADATILSRNNMKTFITREDEILLRLPRGGKFQGNLDGAFSPNSICLVHVLNMMRRKDGGCC
jgi:hypothetical protein